LRKSRFLLQRVEVFRSGRVEDAVLGDLTSAVPPLALGEEKRVRERNWEREKGKRRTTARGRATPRTRA
jgi:hypothetical protein